MEGFDKVLEGISQEILRQIADMKKSKDLNQRKTHAEIVHLLTQSLCSIVDTTTNAAAEMYDSMDDEDFFDDDIDD